MNPFLLTLLLVLWGIPQAGAEDPFNRADNESIIDLAPSHLVMTAKDLEALAKEMKQDYGAQYFSTNPNDRYMKQFYQEQEVIRLKVFDQWDAAKACWQDGNP